MNSKLLKSIFADTHLFILNLTAVFHLTVAIVLRFARFGEVIKSSVPVKGEEPVYYGFWYGVTTVVLMLGGVILFSIIEFMMRLDKRGTNFEMFCPFLFNSYGKAIFLLLLTSITLETVGTTEVVLAVSLFVMVGLNIGKGIIDNMLTKGMLIESEEEEDYEIHRPRKPTSVHPKKENEKSDDDLSV